MAFMSLTNLQQAVIRRLRQVAGSSVQLYAEDIISDYLKETYEAVRSKEWWDQLMVWDEKQVDPLTGLVTVAFTGCRDGFGDVRAVVQGDNTQPLPVLQSNNPNRITGTVARFIEPLNAIDDPTGTFLFRVWPRETVTTVDKPLRIRRRRDPLNLFTDPAVVVPFDSAVLINGAAHSYAADDGTNPAQVQKLGEAFNARLGLLIKQHNTGPVVLDARMRDPIGVTEWTESW